MKRSKYFLNKKILISSFSIFIFGAIIFGVQILEKEMGISLQASVLHTSASIFSTRGSAFASSDLSSGKKRTTAKILAQALIPTQILTPILCTYEEPKNPEYRADVLVKSTRVVVEEGGDFTVYVHYKNSGNVPWFSDTSGCKNVTRLGTSHERDHDSILFNPGDSRWINAHRITMVEDRVDPGQIATFTFASKAPSATDIFREYFEPIAEGVAWMDADSYIDVYVGDVTDGQRENSVYLGKSGQTSALDLSGEQIVEVSIDQQKLWLKFGDTVVREYTVSTGAGKTPTPKGTFKILNKQDLRIGGKSPHYHMPDWQGFTAWGHGLHALPYLENDRGYFWQEAYDHIGHRVSHGCIRLLPQDAEDLYNLTQVGTKIVIHS